ncbi:MAG: diguanylate cyclase/phosphodiesterase [Firmicutes bacterium]|nr:diguanylate cyclase/phosphodiesterase [Bacillota bacterium]
MKLQKYLVNRQLFLLVVPLCIFAGMMFHFVSQYIQNEIYAKNYMIAHSMGNHMATMLDDPLRLLKQIRAVYDQPEEVSPEKTDLLISTILQQEPYFESIEILDDHGLITHRIPGNKNMLAIDRSRQEFFKHIKQGEEFFWSNSFISAETGRPTVMLAIPLQNKILAGYLSLSRLNLLSEGLKENYGSDFFIAVTDANGVYISHLDDDRVLQRQAVEEASSLYQQNHAEQKNYRTRISGKDYLVSIDEIRDVRWHIIVYQSYNEAFSLLQRLELYFSLAAALLLFGGILFSRRMSGAVVEAFAQLNSSFIQISCGKFGEKVREGKFDELNQIVRSFNEMADSIRDRDKRLQKLASQDPLTGLPNRSYFLQKLNDAVVNAEPGGKFAVAFVDLDNFKAINDTHGHCRGDEMLQIVAERLQALMPEKTLLARLGGDEFIFLIKEWDERQGRQWLETVRSHLAKPVQIGLYSLYTGGSIGVAVFPDDSKSADELLQYADMAMYQVKNIGKNGYHFYTAQMHAKLERKINIAGALRKALARQEFTLNYQPLLSVDGNSLRGFEALLRWNCSEFGSVSPMEFIPIAEEIGLINDVGRWVLQNACAKLAELLKKTGGDFIMSVNVSALQIKDVDFIHDVAATLEKHKFRPAHLELEITESAVVGSMEEAVAMLKQLRKMGVKVSLDDFGTGYSSLSYLHHLPIDTIKIDKTFFQDIVFNRRAQDMLDGIVFLSRRLGLSVVAEGIEEEAQADYIASTDCDFVQGYYYQEPMEAHRLARFVIDMLSEENKGKSSLKSIISDL